MGRGRSGAQGRATKPTEDSIMNFNPSVSDRGRFEIDAIGGKATVSGVIDKRNQIGYAQDGSGKWTAYDLETGRAFASTPGSGTITGAVNAAARNATTLSNLRTTTASKAASFDLSPYNTKIRNLGIQSQVNTALKKVDDTKFKTVTTKIMGMTGKHTEISVSGIGSGRIIKVGDHYNVTVLDRNGFGGGNTKSASTMSGAKKIVTDGLKDIAIRELIARHTPAR